jgi:transcriptional regulator with XRE-family HTH domain
MEKSTYTREYSLLIELLKELRAQSLITQTELAEKLGQSQSFISKCERCERRLDVLELNAWCKALGSSLIAFLKQFEIRLAEEESK